MNKIQHTFYKQIEDLLGLFNKNNESTLLFSILILSLTFISAAVINFFQNRNLRKETKRFIDNSINEFSNPFFLYSKNIYAQRIRDNVSEVQGTKILLKKDLSELLYEIIDSSQMRFFSRQMASLIMPISLVLTFILIAASLPSLADAMNSLGQEKAPGKDSVDPLVQFANTLKTISTKFLVSVAGLLCSMAAGIACSFFDKSTKQDIVEDAKSLQVVYKIETESEIATQNNKQLLAVSSEQLDFIKETARNTQKIDNMVVKVEDFSEEVIRRLENMVNRSLVERMTALSQQQTEELKTIANSLTERFAIAIEKSMERIVDSLDKNVSMLSTKVTQQGEGQIESLLKKFENVISGGVSTQASELKSTISEMRIALPEVVNTLKHQIAEMTAQRQNEINKSDAIITQILTTTDLQQRFVDQMKTDTITMREGLNDFAKNLFEQQKLSMEGFAQKFIKENIETGLGQLESFESKSAALESDRVRRFEEHFALNAKDQKELIEAMKALADKNTSMISSTEKMIQDLSTQTANQLAQSLKPILRDVNEIQKSLRNASDSIASTLSAIDERERIVQGSIKGLETAGHQMTITSTKLEHVGQTFDASVREVGRVVAEIPNSTREISQSLKSQAIAITEQRVNLETYSKRMIEVMSEGTASLAERYIELANQSKQLGDHTLSRVNDELGDLNDNMQKLSKAIETRLKAG